ncbi:subtilase family protein [Arcicella aurantiaca]|uniref:Subtilase family protein n=1 Tax=Arcicella aurantiaca TaxID=591202 RepID=A0A316ECP8_9BACT|nr:S8 family serine peptidase [Arcicella aurantiaca]PWK27910.1 subtilase family protein [Arcicella aurantiaca]
MKKLIIALLCLLVHFADAQNGKKKLPNNPSPVNPHPDTTINDTRFVWYKGGYVARDQKIILLDKNSAKYKLFKKDKLLISIRQSHADKLHVPIDSIKVLRSCDCDEELYLLGASNLYSTAVIPDPDGSSGGSGDNNGYTGSPNPETELTGLNNPLNPFSINTFKSDSSQKEIIDFCKLNLPIKIAYIDGGLRNSDPNLFASYRHFYYLYGDFGTWRNPNNDKFYGYNFTTSPKSQNIEEDGCPHGVNISHILAGEFRHNAPDGTLMEASVKIMPLKVFQNGKGNLFDALCAILYAQKNRFDIINCSWGHKGVSNPIFEKIIKSLEIDNIMVVASAGNDCQELGSNNYGHYPAMFSKRFSNVISVTTVIDPPNALPTLITSSGSTDTPCVPDNFCGNYGRDYVNVGYRGGTTFQVRIGYPLSQSALYGTSYAAAHITGMLANNYLKYLKIRRDNILNTGSSPSIRDIFLNDTSLFEKDIIGYPYIKNGKINKR